MWAHYAPDGPGRRGVTLVGLQKVIRKQFPGALAVLAILTVGIVTSVGVDSLVAIHLVGKPRRWGIVSL